MIEIIDGKGVGAGKSYYATMRVIDHVRRGGTVFYGDSFVLFPAQIAKLVERSYGLELPMVETSRDPATYHESYWDMQVKMVQIINQELFDSGYATEPIPEMPPEDRFPQFRCIPHGDIWRVHELTAGGTDDCPVLIILDEV